MKKEIADLWISALRSGRYKQCKRVLNNGEGMCCLGVLCDISGLNTWEACNQEYPPYGYYSCGSQKEFLPKNVQEWAGVDSESPSYSKDNIETNRDIYLHELNDEDGLTFAEIADRIESNWEQL